MLTAGIAAYPMMLFLINIIAGMRWSKDVQAAEKLIVVTQQLTILGNLSLAAMAVWALIVIGIMGVFRDIKAELPGGSSVDINLDNTPDTTQTPEVKDAAG